MHIATVCCVLLPFLIIIFTLFIFIPTFYTLLAFSEFSHLPFCSFCICWHGVSVAFIVLTWSYEIVALTQQKHNICNITLRTLHFLKPAKLLKWCIFFKCSFEMYCLKQNSFKRPDKVSTPNQSMISKDCSSPLESKCIILLNNPFAVIYTYAS